MLAHPLNDSFYRERTPDLSKIDYPALVIANWGGLGLHLRGTIRGYLGIASREKWLKIQSGSYFHTFLLPARRCQIALAATWSISMMILWPRRGRMM